MGLELLAFVAGFIGAVSTVPQIYHMIKTKNTIGVSTQMFMMKNVAYAMWMGYGLVLGSVAIIFWNFFAFVMSSAVLVAKYKIGKAELQKPSNIMQLDFSQDVVMEEPNRRPHLKLVYSANSARA